MDSALTAIVGPTAAGKTIWALALAREQNGEIISIDSRQVYRHLTIGTAKPGWNGISECGIHIPPKSEFRIVVEGIPTTSLIFSIRANLFPRPFSSAIGRMKKSKLFLGAGKNPFSPAERDFI